MWPRLSIVAGLVAGVAVAGMVFGAIVLLGPAPTAPVAAATPSPSPVTAAGGSASPGASASAASATASAVSSAGIPSPSPSGSVAPSNGPSSPATAPSGSAGPSSSPAASPSAETLFHIGEPAPALKLPKVGGGTIDLASLSGSPVWLDFMGTYSAASQDEFPLMDGFAKRYADAGLVVVAVDVREEEAIAAGFAQSLGTTFPMALDKDGSTAARWGAFALPVHYWIDAEGIVRDAASGGIGPDVMARGVTTILPGVDVQP
jgi:cytochrome c biogenesis protein CcmG, thiol:disulfide interchange protein DsbE